MLKMNIYYVGYPWRNMVHLFDVYMRSGWSIIFLDSGEQEWVCQCLSWILHLNLHRSIVCLSVLKSNSEKHIDALNSSVPNLWNCPLIMPPHVCHTLTLKFATLISSMPNVFGSLALSGERWTYDQKVVSSTPSRVGIFFLKE